MKLGKLCFSSTAVMPNGNKVHWIIANTPNAAQLLRFEDAINSVRFHQTVQTPSPNLFIAMAEGNSSNLATEASLLQAMMSQKMQDLDTDVVVDQVFVPIPDSSSGYMLGPCFRTEFPSDLTDFYPLVNGEKLLLHSSAPDWSKAKNLRSWPVVHKVWTDWVDRVQKARGEVWKLAGIFDAIQLSRFEIPMDKNLVYAALCFWSVSSNSFHFKFGMMGPSVLDIVALTGLRPHGEEVSALLDDPEFTYAFPKNERGKDINAYLKFVDASMGVTAVTDHEHVSFLAMWLCKFLFCNASVKMTKEYTQLAIALATGQTLALAPFVLSHLYRGCRDITTSKFGHAGGPFWILQLWLQSYFPEYRPLTFDVTDAPNYGFPLAQGELRPKSFDECFRFFHTCTSRTASQFTPFSSTSCGPEWLKPDSSILMVNNETKDIWASYLIARDLHYSLIVDKSVNCKCGVEFYAPNQFARQFGLTQAIPLPPYQTANVSSIRRVVFQTADRIEEIQSKIFILKQKFSFLAFKENPKATKFFDSWWSTYIAATRTESIEDILGRISPAVAHLSSPTKQEAVASESADSHHIPPIVKEHATKKRAINKGRKELENSAEEQAHPSKRAKTKSLFSRTPRVKTGGKLVAKTNLGSKCTSAVTIAKSFGGAFNNSLPFAKPISQDISEINIQAVDFNMSSSRCSLSLNQEAGPSSPLQSSAEIGAKFSAIVDSAGDPVKLENIDDFFARVSGQLRRAQSLSFGNGKSSYSDPKFMLVTKSPMSMEALAKAKQDVERLLAMPFLDLLHPENQSALRASLSTYAASPDLAEGRIAALEKLKTSLPSLSFTFRQAKKDQAEYYKAASKKIVLIDELTKGQEIYTNLRNCQEKLCNTINSINDQIKELKVSLKEAKTKKTAIEEQQLALAKTCFTRSAALEEMEAELPAMEEKKEQADSDLAHVEAAWTDFKSKIFDSEN